MLFVLSVLTTTLTIPIVFADDKYGQNFDANKIKHLEYNFDEVNVLYAVKFEASPETGQARSGNLKQDEWY